MKISPKNKKVKSDLIKAAGLEQKLNQKLKIKLKIKSDSIKAGGDLVQREKMRSRAS